MSRYKLTLEYDGASYAGWQRQADQPSIQEALETAAAAINGVATEVTGAGRTDAGVHAFGQVAHLDMIKPMPADKVRDALNAHLRPHPIAVLKSAEAADGFHARFDATGRSYIYRIVNRRPDLTFDRERAWRVPMKLDADAMHAAAQLILGKHDFTTFRAAECQAKSPDRTLDVFNVARQGEIILVTARARSFLHSQVRSMVGSLKLVGEGRWTPRDFRAALDARDRSKCGPLAPPDGLYLTRVDY